MWLIDFYIFDLYCITFWAWMISFNDAFLRRYVWWFDDDLIFIIDAPTSRRFQDAFAYLIVWTMTSSMDIYMGAMMPVVTTFNWACLQIIYI